PQAEENLAATSAADRAIPVSAEKASSKNLPTKTPARPSPTPAADELVIYEKGKVIFRMKPAAPKSGSDAVVEASSTTKIVTPKTPMTKAAATKTGTAKAAARSVWLSQAQAETHLLSRVEPQYPAEALAAHRAGDVVLEVQVSEDGSVSNVRTLAGDPLLAAAASEAVRNWRYRPYRQNDQPAQFQTDVTLSFTLPN
ncbi:MAG: TonB family protein, partial [Terriglobales bacterium]